METEFSRTVRLIGETAFDKLKNASVAVFGIGGVGSAAAEALARAGVGRLCLVDSDTVSVTNINRQLIALHSTVGKNKVDVAAQRIADINPDAAVEAVCAFYDSKTQDEFDLSRYDYIVDAIDTVTSKLLLIENAARLNVPVISSMGTGNKLDASAFEVCDIYKTTVCPLARVMRRELKARGIKKLKVVYSKEIPLQPKLDVPLPEGKRQVPASISFVPPVAGYIMAGEIIKELIGNEKPD